LKEKREKKERKEKGDGKGKGGRKIRQKTTKSAKQDIAYPTT